MVCVIFCVGPFTVQGDVGLTGSPGDKGEKGLKGKQVRHTIYVALNTIYCASCRGIKD